MLKTHSWKVQSGRSERTRQVLMAGALLVGAAMWQRDAALAAAEWVADVCTTATPMFTTSAALSEATGRPATTVQVLSCEKLANVPGKTMTTALVTFPPLAHTPAHRHPGAVTAFVVSGAVRSQLAGSAAQTYPAGATWFEPQNTLHLFAENPSATEAAQLLAVFVADENCGPLTVLEPAVSP